MKWKNINQTLNITKFYEIYQDSITRWRLFNIRNIRIFKTTTDNSTLNRSVVRPLSNQNSASMKSNSVGNTEVDSVYYKSSGDMLKEFVYESYFFKTVVYTYDIAILVWHVDSK